MKKFKGKLDFSFDCRYCFDSSQFQKYRKEIINVNDLPNHYALVVSDGMVQQGVVTNDGIFDVRALKNNVMRGKSRFQVTNATWAAILWYGYNPFFNEWSVLEYKIHKWGISQKAAREKVGEFLTTAASVPWTNGTPSKEEYSFVDLCVDTPENAWEILSTQKAVRYENGEYVEVESLEGGESDAD